MFVDLSGKAKPGIRVQVPLWVTQLVAPVSITVRGSLNDASGYQTTDVVTAGPPEWRGDASLAMPSPGASDSFSAYIEVDPDHRVSTYGEHRGVTATLPTPRPNTDESLPCQVVT